MFALITQKFQFQRAGLLIATAFVALSMSACTPSEQPLPSETAESTTLTPSDYCPNLPDVYSQDELPDTYVQDYSVERGSECVPKEQVRERLAEMDRQHQESVAKATALVLGSLPLSEATVFDRMMQAVAYYCNHIGEPDAEMAARLVYNANYVPDMPSPTGEYMIMDPRNSFEKITDLACGHLKQDHIEPVPPIEQPPVSTVGA